MSEHLTLLKRLLTDRHWQTYRTFLREYGRAAAHIDPVLARTTPCEKQYQRWINGRLLGLPHPVHCQILEAMFPGYSVHQLFAPDRTPGVTDASGAILGTPALAAEEQPTDRRDALRTGGALAAGYLLDSLHTEPDRLHAILDTGTVGAERLAALEHTAEELGVRAGRTNPPSVLVPEVLAEFRAVRTLLEHRQRIADQVRLTRVAARLATVLGSISFDEGQLAASGRWYETARHAALEAGDVYLADMALGANAYLPAYSQNPGGVLRLLEPRLDAAKLAPSPATAFLWASAARAHATLGENIAFRHAINRARQAMDARPPDDHRHSVFTFLPGKLAFYQATGCARLGDVTGATEAADRALGLYDLTITGEPALIRLDKATALARAGEIPEATRIASHALLDPHTYLGNGVLTRAREFDALLGAPRTP
ncbi:MAG TPA: hypothetical protein VFX70_18080, partial [Mycobacteriales bacterium]|nr:hypothetical protein [Mycobacteriales bacterium]